MVTWGRNRHRNRDHKRVRQSVSSLMLMLMLMPISGMAASEVYLVSSGSAPYYERVAKVFTDELLARLPGVKIHRRDVHNAEVAPGAVLVTIGSEATALAINNYPGEDILSLLLPMAAWRDLNVIDTADGRRAAVVIDQPFERALILGKLLKPGARKFGAVFGPAAQVTRSDSLERASRIGIEVVWADLSPADNPISVLTPVVQQADIFVAVPGRAVFNRNTAKWVLHLGFRQQIPVIGFSKSYTDAGALASVYSSPENIGRHGGELLADLLGVDAAADASALSAANSAGVNSQVPGSWGGNPDNPDNIATTSAGSKRGGDDQWRAYYPRYYTLSTNPEVARLLDITLPSSTELYRMYSDALQSAQ